MTTRYSKFLSYVLRHHPEELSLTLDEGGWVGVDALLRAAAERDPAWTAALLDEVVAANSKQRFVMSADGERIRARQGHSVPIDLGYEPAAPPAELYHGTVAEFLDAILDEGLQRGQRHDVHLSADVPTAREVGGRRGKPIVLVVDAARMHTDGFEFRVSENGVWLTAAVPPKYLERLQSGT